MVKCLAQGHKCHGRDQCTNKANKVYRVLVEMISKIQHQDKRDHTPLLW